jgi:hypothetical protein
MYLNFGNAMNIDIVSMNLLLLPRFRNSVGIPGSNLTLFMYLCSKVSIFPGFLVGMETGIARLG